MAKKSERASPEQWLVTVTYPDSAVFRESVASSIDHAHEIGRNATEKMGNLRGSVVMISPLDVARTAARPDLGSEKPRLTALPIETPQRCIARVSDDGAYVEIDERE